MNNRIEITWLCLLLIGAALLLGCGNRPAVPVEENTPTPEVEEEATPVEQPSEFQPASLSEIDTAEEANTIDSVTVYLADSVDTLEPYYMVDSHPDASVSVHLWDGLTRLNENLEVEPALAESWRLVNNFTWEFKLRPNVFFQNDEPFNAEAARYSINRSKSLPNSLETFSRDIDLKEVEVVDNLTIRLTTNQPLPNLPYYLAFLEMLPPAYYQETSLSQLAVAPRGTGPYRLSEETTDEQLVLEASPDYWGEKPVISKIIFKTAASPEERLAALEQDEFVLATDLPPIPADQWTMPNSKLEPVESTQRMLIGINVNAQPPLGNQLVRQALNYAIDVDQIAEDYLAGYGERYGSWINPPHHSQSLLPWPYDPERARELLAEAGYTDGFTTTLATPIGVYPNDFEIAKAVARQLEEVGIHAVVEQNEWPIFARRLLSENKPPLFLLGINSHGDALEDAKNLSTHFPFNPTEWENENFELAVNRASYALNDEVRARRLDEVQAIAYNEAPWIWLWRAYDFYGVSNGLNWTPRRDGVVNLYKPQAN
jgi:peptide/nickel transport system substrate-binding protein